MQLHSYHWTHLMNENEQNLKLAFSFSAVTPVASTRADVTDNAGVGGKPICGRAGGPCYQYSTPLSAMPAARKVTRKNVHFMNVPDDTPINLTDLDKSFDKS